MKILNELYQLKPIRKKRGGPTESPTYAQAWDSDLRSEVSGPGGTGYSGSISGASEEESSARSWDDDIKGGTEYSDNSDEYTDDIDQEDYKLIRPKDAATSEEDPEFSMDANQEETPPMPPDEDTSSIPGEEPEDPALADGEEVNNDQQGQVRHVKAAHLVYKAQEDDGTWTELWHYNIGEPGQNEQVRSDQQIRDDILAGTDIPKNQITSEDGSQQYSLWTAGNAQMMQVKGLPR